MGPIASEFANLCTSLYPILPDCRSGNTNTLALPATLLFGAFCFATFSTIAASNCSSPSINKSGLKVFASSVAILTFSTLSWSADPIDEKLNIATLGSILQTFFAVSAVAIAIAASSL
ncbi:hypothetical protein D3C76_1402480 [compost metagenome]